MRTKNVIYRGVWLSAFAWVVYSITTSHNALLVKLGLACLTSLVLVGFWVDATGAWPKMSEHRLSRLKVVLFLLATLSSYLLYALVRPFRSH